MRLVLTCLLAALLGTPVFAQSDDIRVSLSAFLNDPGEQLARVPVNTTLTYLARLRSEGLVRRDTEFVLEIPGRILSVESGHELVGCEPATSSPIRCRIGVPDAYMLDATVAVVTRLESSGTQTATIRLGERVATMVLEVVDLPSLSVFSQARGLAGFRVEPGQGFRIESFLSAVGATATNVRMRHTLPQGGEFIAALPSDAETQCSVTPQEVVCVRPTAPNNYHLRVELQVLAPARLTGGNVVLRVEASNDQQDFNPADDVHERATALVRHLLVTNTNDEGSGSLRQALLESQSLCADGPCTVVFNIPGTPENGFFDIRPKSALPEVRGWVKIDGRTQQAYSMATTGSPASIRISGSEAGLANGLRLGTGCEIQVLGLTITGFAWPGIEGHRGPLGPACQLPLLAVYPNTLIEGNDVSDNYRGVVLVDSGSVTVRNNVIAGNQRAGLFFDGGVYAEVVGNRVEGNGASGVFFDIGNRDAFPGGADVTENVIAGNAEWGIARTNNGEIAIQRNSIFGNGYPAIDLNLDFDTPNRANDDYSSIPNKPVVLSAFYDAAQGTTFVRLRLDSRNPAGARFTLDVYANDSPRRDTTEWVGMLHTPGGNVNGELTIAIAKNLKGRYVVATSTRMRILGFAKPPGVAAQSHLFSTPADTSEVSEAVVVQ